MFSYRIVFLVCVFAVILYVNCTQPLQNESPDQIEFVSVWQYLKTYSIYQEKIPENPFVYNSPQAMIDHIEDTLKKNPYTVYVDENRYPVRANTTSQIKSNVKYDNLVSVDPLTDSCCLLKIVSFKDDTNSISVLEQFHNALEKVQKYSKIIIDVRENGGGDLITTDSIINDILPKGMPYIHVSERVYDPTQKSASTVTHDWFTTRSPKSAFANKKLAVLIDGGSASASEILAAALKSCLGVPLIGERSYGKGIGQIIITRRGRLGLQITFAHFYKIIDKNAKQYEDYHRKGIVPDDVPLELQAEANIINIGDKSLFYAIKILEPSAVLTGKNFSTLRKLYNSLPGQSGLFKMIDESSL